MYPHHPGPDEPPELPLTGDLIPKRRSLIRAARRTRIVRNGETIYVQQINNVQRMEIYHDHGGASGGRRQHRLGKAALVLTILTALVAVGDWLGPFSKVATTTRAWSTHHPWLSWLVYVAIFAVAAIAIAWITEKGGIAVLGALAFVALGVAKSIAMGWFDFVLTVGHGIAGTVRWLAGFPGHHPWLTWLIVALVTLVVGFVAGVNTDLDGWLAVAAIGFVGLLGLGVAQMIRHGWFHWVAVTGRAIATAVKWLAGFPGHHPWLTWLIVAVVTLVVGFIAGVNTDLDGWFGVAAIGFFGLVGLGITQAVRAGWFGWIGDVAGWIGRQAHDSPWTFGGLALGAVLVAGGCVSAAVRAQRPQR